MVDATVNSQQLLAYIKSAIESLTYVDGDPQYFGSDSDAQQQWNGTYFEGPNPSATTNMWEDAPSIAYGDPSISSLYYEHFWTYDANDWTVTTTEGGAGDATEALSTDAGFCENGVLKITNDAAAPDCDELQLKGEAWYLASLTAGKKIWFETRIAVSDATQSNILIGLCITDTDLVTNFTTAPCSDGIYFSKDDGDTNWDFHAIKNSTLSSTTAIGTCSTAWTRLGFKYDGAGILTPYFNGTAGTAITTNIPDDEQLTLTLFIWNGEAAAKSLYVDFVKIQQLY